MDLSVSNEHKMTKTINGSRLLASEGRKSTLFKTNVQSKSNYQLGLSLKPEPPCARRDTTYSDEDYARKKKTTTVGKPEAEACARRNTTYSDEDSARKKKTTPVTKQA